MTHMVVRIAACLALFGLCAAQAPSSPSSVHKAPPHAALSRKGRAIQSLDGAWRFETDPDGAGEARGWQKSVPPGARDAMVPALLSDVAPRYKGAAWYWREFDVPASWQGQTLRLRFGAVAERAAVWLNGVSLGAHGDGATPFEFNVTSVARPGEKSILAVRVYGAADTGAGIWQSVQLLSHDEAYISDCFPMGDGLGDVAAAITLLNLSKISADASLDGRLVQAAPFGKVREVKRTGQILALTPGRNVTTMLASIRGKDMVAWSPQTPTLYRLQLTFRQGADVLDTLDSTFGFRELALKDGAVTLNGRAITLLSSAPRSPILTVLSGPDGVTRARAMLRSERDKNLNVLHLQAPPPGLLSLADEMGIFVVESVRSQSAGAERLAELRELVLRDRAHPSILAWDLGDADVSAAQSIRQLDSTRFLLMGAPGARNVSPPGFADSALVACPPGLDLGP